MPPSPEGGLTLVAARPRVAVMAEKRDGHAFRLVKALRGLGAEARRVSLVDCVFDTTQRAGLVVPGFGRRLPDAVLVRSIPAGTFEAVTRRLGILHALREQGVLVWNDARAIERCVDKSTTSFFLAKAGIPTPTTWAVENHAAAAAIVRRETLRGPLVFKPLFGSQGRGLKLVRQETDLPRAEEASGVYYLQRFMGEDREGFHDYRVFVIAGRAVAAMARHHRDWITNVKRGGEPRPAALDPELSGLAERAARAVEADFCGVDILRLAVGRGAVLEVNSMPAWSGLRKVSPVDITGHLAAALLAALGEAEARRRA
ncbi:MAG: RimK family alpha-L-glutamate ligase [Parvibaculaceae bacterium]